MDAQRLLIAHCEKLILAVVVILGTWAVYSSWTNPDIQLQATKKDLDSIAKHLTDAQRDQVGPPNFKPVRRYDRELPVRLDLRVGAVAMPSWLTTHPDLGGQPPKDQKVEPYIFEIGEPLLAGVSEARVRTLAVNVQFPLEKREKPAETNLVGWVKDRTSPAGAQWSRQIVGPAGNETIPNQARILGVQVQYAAGAKEPGEAAWKPLDLPAIPGGFLPHDISSGSLRLEMPNLEESQTYWFRCRLIAAATSYSLASGQPRPQYGEELLVVSPALPDKDVPTTREAAEELHRLVADQAAGGEAKQLIGAELPPGLPEPKPFEKVHAGVWSKPRAGRVGSNMRLALVRVDDFQQPVVAKFLVMKWHDRGAAFGGFTWTVPKEIAVEVGQEIGSENELVEVPMKDGGKNQYKLDMRTQFKLLSVKAQDVDRVRWYEIKYGSPTDDQGGLIPGPQGQQKYLHVIPRTGATQVAEVENLVTKDRRTLVRLERTPLNQRPLPNVFFFPDFQGKPVHELELFGKDPSTFALPELQPEPPVVHSKDYTLLERLALAGKIPADLVPGIELPYIQLPDGRVVYHYPLDADKRPKVVTMPGTEAAQTPIPEAAAPAPAPAPAQP